MFQCWACFAEFERAMIQKRVRAGLARARGQGKQLGRLKVTVQTERETVLTKANKSGLRRIASASGAR
jgi:DNA invertase Pin-like site-specific DNA recombinase